MVSTPEERAKRAAYMRAYRVKNLERVKQQEREKDHRRRADPTKRAALNEAAASNRLARLAKATVLCSITGCDRTASVSGLCEMHYLRKLRKGSTGTAEPLLRTGPPSERFWPRVDVRGPEECWPWTGAQIERGYGRFGLNGRSVPAYRFAYEDTVGPVPEGLELDHLCRNPTCCNPAHLEPVTHAENMRRSKRKECARGHEWTPETTRIRPSDGSRQCILCGREDGRKAYQRRKARQV
jgi:hypothetical protein